MPENLFTKQMELIELYITANKSSNRILRFIMEAETSNYSLTSTPHTLHQRPPSVGMPRHAFRRRIPNSTHTTPPSAVAARWPGIFFLLNSLPTGGGAPGGCYPKYIPTKIVRSGYDLENQSITFSETLHVGLK